jgi:hypothetical protein
MYVDFDSLFFELIRERHVSYTYHVPGPLRQQKIIRQPPLEMMSSSLSNMVVQSRRASRSTSNDVHKEPNSQPSVNEYELEWDHRKKALHDRVELALIESRFGEAAKLRSAFNGERTTGTPAPQSSQPWQRRIRIGATLAHKRRRSVRNLHKTGAAVILTSTSEGGGKKVRLPLKVAMCMLQLLRQLGYASSLQL